MSATQLKALCLVVLIASCLAAGTNGESAQQRSRKLLQPRNPQNIQANTVRAQAATSQVCCANKLSDPDWLQQ